MNPISLVITVCLCLSILVVPRKYLLLPFIAAACIIPMDQRIIVVEMDFTSLRFCVLAGFIRLFLRGEMRPIQFNHIDKLFFAWLIAGAIIYVLQWQSFDAVINRSGVLFDGVGLYWIFRQSFRNWNDVVNAIQFFAFFAILSAPLFLVERIQQHSPYSILGHSPAAFHRGRFRCSGPFPHFIMMGLFWACILPWFYACIKAGFSKSFYWIAIAAALLCVVLSGSSTPLMTVCFAVPLWLLFRYRHYGKQITAGILIMLTCLHLVMNKPVWHLMSRFSFFDGSTGWHRYALFDRFINHASEWFFLGTRSTIHWGWGMQDVTNQYVLEGVRGGFLTLCLFLALNVMCVVVPGKGSIRFKNKKLSWLSWGICVSVLAHSVSFWGVSYFGQIIMLLYLTIALAAFVQEQMDTSLRQTVS